VKTVFKLLILTCCIAALLTCAGQPQPVREKGPSLGPFLTGGTLVFEDNFDGDSLDETRWNIETGTGNQYGLNGWGNNEKQFYMPDNVYVKDGVLHLEARKDSGRSQFPYTSGKITTGGIKNADGKVKNLTFSLEKGRVEARIKSTRGEGLWPAFWLLGANSNAFGGHKAVGWPACGEIDILEIRGGEENRFLSTIHYGSSWGNYRSKGDYLDAKVSLADDWHIYGVSWDEYYFNFLFDGKIWYSIELAEIDKGPASRLSAFTDETGFIININLAVGGNFIGGKTPPNSIFETGSPVENRTFQIDWVRVYTR